MIAIDNNRTVFERSKISTDNKPVDFICQLSETDQQIVKMALVSTLCYQFEPTSEEFEDALSNGLNGRLCDLEDTIDIEYVNTLND